MKLDLGKYSQIAKEEMALELPKNISDNIQNFAGRTWLLPVIIDWFEHTNERMFILTGGPGTGKSMVAGWLSGNGPKPTDPDAAVQLAHIRQSLKAIHFCMAASRSNSPQALAENIANQLTGNVIGFGEALAATLSERVQLTAVLQIQTVAAGSSITGISIGRIDLGTLGDELSFDRALTQPLNKLYASGYNEPILLLVDALDEAQTYTGSITLIQLLAKLVDLPQQVRVLATTRPDPRILKYFLGVRQFDLISNAPKDIDDVQEYVTEQLSNFQTVSTDQRTEFSERLSKAAEGIFLYAYMVLSDLRPSFPKLPDLERYPLPKGLSGLYHEFLNRELGKDEDRWYEIYKPLLGFIAVSQGEGLPRTLLQQMIGKDIEQALRVCKQYLAGDFPEGPFRSFHRSFDDFLVDDKANIDYHIDASEMHRKIADFYLQSFSNQWIDCDIYGLRHLTSHLFHSGNGGVKKLGALLTSHDWIWAKLKNTDAGQLVNDYNFIKNDRSLELVGRAVALSVQSASIDFSAFRSQLYGRLMQYQEDYPNIRLLNNEIEKCWGSWLRPYTPSLVQPDDPLIMSMDIELDQDIIDAIAITPDGLISAIASSNQLLSPSDPELTSSITVLDIENRRIRKKIDGFVGRFDALGILPDGKCILLPVNNNIEVWNLENGKKLGTLWGHKARIRAISVRSDGMVAVSIANDQMVKIWDLDQYREIRFQEFSSEPWRSIEGFDMVSVTSNGEYAVFGSFMGQIIIIYDLKNNAIIQELNVPAERRGYESGGWFTSAIMRGGQQIILGQINKLRFWDYKKDKEPRTIGGHANMVKSIALTQDGKIAIVASEDNSVRVWNLELAKDEITKDHSDWITALAITKDGKYVASGSADALLKVWDLKSGKTMRTIYGGSFMIDAISFSPNGKQIIIASKGGPIKLLDVETGNEIGSLDLRLESWHTYDIAILNDGSNAICFQEEKLRFLDITEMKVSLALEAPNFSTILLEAGETLITKENNRIVLRNINTGEIFRQLEVNMTSTNALAITQDESKAITVSNDNVIRIWDLKSGRELKAFKGFEERICAVAQTLEGLSAVSVSKEGKIRIWDIERCEELARLEEIIGQSIGLFKLSKNGKYGAYLQNGILNIWDLEKRSISAKFSGDSYLTHYCTTPDFGIIVVGELSGELHFLKLHDPNAACSI